MARSAFVPISMGASGAVSLGLGDFVVTDAAFPARDVLPMHVHARASLAIMLEGSFDLRITHRDLPCEPGSAVSEPAEERHANYLGTAGAHVVVVQPDPARVARLGPCAALFDTVMHRPRSPVLGIAWRIARELRRPDTATLVMVEGLVLELLGMASRRRRRDGPGGHEPAWLARAREALHAQFREPPAVAELARDAGVHPDSLARAFRMRYGISIGGYVRRLRLEWASVRMTQRDDSLAQIALDAGFADQSHFTRAFKALTGQTPAEYRRRSAH